MFLSPRRGGRKEQLLSYTLPRAKLDLRLGDGWAFARDNLDRERGQCSQGCEMSLAKTQRSQRRLLDTKREAKLDLKLGDLCALA